MKKHLSKMMMIMAACLLAVSPAFAGDGAHCHMAKAADGTEMKQCKADCDKPCCAHKDGKVCPTHGAKDDCCKKGSATQNFGPRSRK